MPSKSPLRHSSHRGAPLIPIIDLFAGPGGLSEGFATPTDRGGTGRFQIALSIEKDPIAHQTLELRALFRQFPTGEAPEEYYRHIRGEIPRQSLFAAPGLAGAVASARTEAWNTELGAASEQAVLSRIQTALAGADDSVLIGGPPCQAYSLVGRSRNRGNPNYDPRFDGRHLLYREYLKVLAAQRPAVFVMENVKGLLSATLEEQSVLARILQDLHDPGRATGVLRHRGVPRYRIYALAHRSGEQAELFESPPDWRDFIVRCENHGVPQARHRLILLGVREDLRRPAGPTLRQVPPHTLVEGIGDLPPVRSGLTDRPDSAKEWLALLSSVSRERWFLALRERDSALATLISKSISKKRDLNRGGEFVAGSFVPCIHRNWYHDERVGGALNHTTRAHIAEDLFRYLFASAFGKLHNRSPTLNDFPKAVLPDHRNVSEALQGSLFQDRFRVQLAHRPSTTITSHISKDGHYYIHYDPSQCRSLTAREAARAQTFPDNYFFCGGRTAQYHQIGNAVPPYLAMQIARIVADLMS